VLVGTTKWSRAPPDSVLFALSRGYSPLAVALFAGAALIKKRTR
jgi:hypothetical protein